MAKNLFLISFFICLVVVNGNVRNNCSAKRSVPDKCSFRYDLITGMAQSVFNKFTCESWFANQFCICAGKLKIWYYNCPPYMMKLPNGSVDGIIPAIFKLALQTCCKNCTVLEYLSPFATVEESSAHFYDPSYYSVIMPVLGVRESKTFFGFPFTKLIDTPGVIYVQIDNSSDEVMEKFLKSLLGTWPLFLLIMLLTIQGGVIIWLLDTRKNPEEFPPSFVKGSLEGSWWAYVSMTTVGYGDKSPRSFFGRLFAVFWITIGIALSGIFTASISSSLTSAAIGEKLDLNRKDIGFLEQTVFGYEENIIYREGGLPTGYSNVSEMVQLLDNGNISGILIDKFRLRFYWKYFENTKHELQLRTDIQNSETGVGMMFSSPQLNEWAVFFRSFFEENKDAENRLLMDAMRTMESKLPQNLKFTSSSPTEGLFSSTNVYIELLVIMCISSVCIIAFGLSIEIIKRYHFWQKRKKIARDMTEMTVKESSFDSGSLEKRFDDFTDILENSVLENLRDQVKELRKDVLRNQGKKVY